MGIRSERNGCPRLIPDDSSGVEKQNDMTTTEFHSHYQDVQQYLHAFALKLTTNEEDAKDLQQETLFRAFAHKNQFRPGTNFKAWVTTIMRYAFISDYRKKKIRKDAPVSLHAFDHSANEAPSSLMLQELYGLLGILSEVQRTCFDLFFEGFTYDEIAQKLNVPIGSIKSRIFFARKKLKGMIKRNYGEEHLLSA